jgi:hypothetical protein
MAVRWHLTGLVVLSALGIAPVSEVAGEAGGTSRTFVVNLQHLELAKEAWQGGDPIMTADVENLIKLAEDNLSAGPYSVTFHSAVAPSGDPHDIVSYGYYWYPNPDTPDGLPWISRDGFGNPENEVEWTSFGLLRSATWRLSLAYFFTGDERYAEKSASLLRTWFLSPETRMNARDEYSNMIPGISPGSFNAPGFANTFDLLIDVAGILEASPHWTAEDKQGLQQWMRDLMQWAEASPKGERQRQEPANHGTNYDFLFTLLSVYVGDVTRAEEHYLNYALDRMPGQLSDGGYFVHEMQRANNLLYHRYHLDRAFDLAAVGANHLDSLDLFHHETDDGRGLRRVLDFLTPYFTGELVWNLWPGDPFPLQPEAYYDLLRKAAVYYHDPALLEAADRLGYTTVWSVNLTHPEAAVFETLQLGDANLDGVFNSADFVHVFEAGKYELDLQAGWAEGDWNRDRRFDTNDFIAAFLTGGYERKPDTARIVVPEPSGRCLLSSIVLGAFSFRFRRRLRRIPSDHRHRSQAD